MRYIIIFILVIFAIVYFNRDPNYKYKFDGIVYYGNGVDIDKGDRIKLRIFFDEKGVGKGDLACYYTETMREERCGKVKDSGFISDNDILITVEESDGDTFCVLTH